MKRIYVSTIHRINEEPVTSLYGHLYVLDLDTKKILNDVTQSVSTNGIGRSKGTRGIAFANNIIYVASSDSTITAYNADTYKIINHKLIGEIEAMHQLEYHAGLLHAASSQNDKVVRLNTDLEVVSVESLEHPVLEEHCGPIPWSTEKLHFNSLCWLPNGDELHVYCALNMVFNYTKKKVVVKAGPSLLNGTHDIVPIMNDFIVNSSGHCKTYRHTGDKHFKLVFSVPEEEIKQVGRNQWGFTRGLALHKRDLFVAYTPMKIVQIQTDGWNFKQVDKIDMNQGDSKSIYDIYLDPRDWN